MGALILGLRAAGPTGKLTIYCISENPLGTGWVAILQGN